MKTKKDFLLFNLFYSIPLCLSLYLIIDTIVVEWYYSVGYSVLFWLYDSIKESHIDYLQYQIDLLKTK